MGTATDRMKMWRVMLRLGRVSNLPTLWSNVFVGIVLSGDSAQISTVVILLLAISLIYVAGMFLNDAFDREIDASYRADRPIPSGEIAASTVFICGFSMLLAGVLLLALTNSAAFVSGCVLAALVVFYDLYHKGNPLSPLIMGLCRMLVYITSALAITGGHINLSVWSGSLILLAYLIGLTYIAKHEIRGHITRLWPLAGLAAPVIYSAVMMPWNALTLVSLTLFMLWTLRCLWLIRANAKQNIPLAVSGLIAGISLNDALLISSQNATVWAIACYFTFILTYFAQRRIAGT